MSSQLPLHLRVAGRHHRVLDKLSKHVLREAVLNRNGDVLNERLVRHEERPDLSKRRHHRSPASVTHASYLSQQFAPPSALHARPTSWQVSRVAAVCVIALRSAGPKTAHAPSAATTRNTKTAL